MSLLLRRVTHYPEAEAIFLFLTPTYGGCRPHLLRGTAALWRAVWSLERARGGGAVGAGGRRLERAAGAVGLV